MKTTVQFAGVSKRYRLGLSRTSLPSAVARGFRRALARTSEQVPSENDLWALRDVSFDLHAGDSLALVGSNGAGKSTILKLLARITRPTEGRITAHGTLSALIELGAGFHPDLTGRENVFLNGTILGLKRKEIASRFDEIVAFSELDRFIDTPVKRYSSGMIVRLGFAVASCVTPEILLVDEVLAVGDASFQQKCLARIRSLIDAGTSIIFVSHNFYLIQAVCTSALYLKGGRIQEFGKVRDVLDVYERDLHLERAHQSAREQEGSGQSSSEAGIRINSVEVDGASGSAELRSGQPAQISIHYSAARAMGPIHASVFVMRADGLTCCMMRTKLDDYPLTIEPGDGTLTVQMEPLQLVGGAYYVEAWFLDDSDSLVITPEPGRSEWFLVKSSAPSTVDDSGIFEPIASWKHSSSHQTNGRVEAATYGAAEEATPWPR